MFQHISHQPILSSVLRYEPKLHKSYYTYDFYTITKTKTKVENSSDILLETREYLLLCILV